MSSQLFDLINEGEHQQLDFKFEINDARKIARTLSAFSNTDGGKLLIGVKDNGKIAGIRTEEEYHMLEASAVMYCKPEVQFQVQKWNIAGKTVLEVTIPKLEYPPCYAKDHDGRWLAYLRAEDQNLLANRVLIRVWEKKKRKKGILVRYTEAEEILMNYLKTNDSITLSKFCRIGRLRNRQAEEILSDLIILDILEMNLSEKGTYYTLIPG